MLLFLVAGIILLATHGWFTDQHTVGLILVIAGAVTTVVPILIGGGLLSWIRKS